ncbi:MAG: tetratricopeptide repeat protein [Nitrospira sp.]|nr:tetratricopeptide repeat protein [Nitrospira sp.]
MPRHSDTTMVRKINTKEPRRKVIPKPSASSRQEGEPEDAATPGGSSPSRALPSKRSPASQRRAMAPYPTALATLGLCLLVAVSLFPVTRAGFVWDDSVLTQSQSVRTTSGLSQIWFTPRIIENEAHYWPILYTTFWLEHKLWGLNPLGYHLVSLLLHLAITLLLWRLLLRLGVPGAWVVAAVFAVHPTHVESATWVIGRKDLLASLFYLACALSYLRFAEDRRRWGYVLALPLFVLSLLSKAIAVTLPVSLLIWIWWKRGRVTGADVAGVMPFLLVGLGIILADWAYYQGRDFTSFNYSLTERMLIAAQALWFYVGKLVWPTELAVIYPRWDISVSDPLAWGAVIAAMAVVVLLWIARHRIGRGPLAGVLCFAVTLSPVLGFVDYGYMKFAFVADRYQYLASAAMLAVLIGVVAHGTRRLRGVWRTGVYAMTMGLLVVLGTLSWHQTGIYRDNITFYRHIISLNPQARTAHSNLGLAYQKAGRYEEALAACRLEYQKALKYPADKVWNSWAHVCVGKAAEMLGRFDEAEQYFRRAYEIRPTFPPVLAYLGAFLVNSGQRPGEAIKYFRVLTSMKPGNPDYHSGMGAALAGIGRLKAALRSYDRALALAPYMAEARANREWVLRAMRSRGD